MEASASWNKGSRSPWVLLSRKHAPSKLRAVAPESRDDRSASSIRFSGRTR